MKFYIETYGCQANKSDSEIITSILQSKKHKQTSNQNKAQIIIINTCYVKQTTQNKIINKLKQLQEKYFQNQPNPDLPINSTKAQNKNTTHILHENTNQTTHKPNNKNTRTNTTPIKVKNRKAISYNLTPPQIIITGCMPEIDKKTIKQILPKAILISARQVHKIADAIKLKKDFLGKSNIDKSTLPKSTKSKIYTIQISEGCTNKCSYCATKLARGNIHSFKQENIIKELKHAIKKGHKTIYLTSQDTAAYGLDKNKTSQLPQLLNELTNIKGNFQIRVAMMNPSNTLPILKQLIQSFKSKKIKPFLHLPIQSGSNKVLKHMNRNYKIKDCMKIIKQFRKQIKNISISTDIIVGYPTETNTDFKKTLKLIKKLKPNILNISRYSKRPNTPAEHLKQLSTQELKRRSKLLTQLHQT